MVNMFENFGELGIFGDTLGPVIGEKEKKTAKEKTKQEKRERKEKKTYAGPLKIVFDSIDAIECKEVKEYTEEELFLEITQKTGFSLFEEYRKEFSYFKLGEGLYLLRAGYGSKCEKGSTGTRLLLQQMQDLESVIEADESGVITVESVKAYIKEQYKMDVVLHLIGDCYVPEPCAVKAPELKKLSFPVTVCALTLFGEMIEIEEADYKSFKEETPNQNSAFLTEEESGKEEGNSVSKEILEKVLRTFLPEYAEDLQISYDPEVNVLQVMHKSMSSAPASVRSAENKEDTYPTDAVVSLVFTRIQLSADLFEGKSEITKKELIKHIGKKYPEYSLERTDIQYDKKKNLIIPILRSGKRGCYRLEDTEDYRKEETELMSICVLKERADRYGCMNGTVYYNLPKIPFSVLKEILYFFWDVYVYKRTEALAQIYFVKERKEYEIYIPCQVVSGSSVDFSRSIEREIDPSRILVMEIHSHGAFCANWSMTDNEDELSHRLYAVIGDLPNFRYDSTHIRVRASSGGYFVRVEPQQIFDYPKTQEAFHKDMGKITSYREAMSVASQEDNYGCN